jgi:adenylate kinase
MPSRFKSFLILGAPGSGKGTQGKILGAIPRFYHFSMGDAFRQLDTRTPIGQEFIKHSSEGKLVPDELTVRFWKTQIDSHVETHAYKPDIDFLILDGIPRNIAQAELMEEHVDVQQVFHLSCPNRDELARRMRKRALKEGRMDDANEITIQHRITTYEQETKELYDFYGGRREYEIDATQPPAKVLHDILGRIMQLPAWSDFTKIGT